MVSPVAFTVNDFKVIPFSRLQLESRGCLGAISVELVARAVGKYCRHYCCIRGACTGTEHKLSFVVTTHKEAVRTVGGGDNKTSNITTKSIAAAIKHFQTRDDYHLVRVIGKPALIFQLLYGGNGHIIKIPQLNFPLFADRWQRGCRRQ